MQDVPSTVNRILKAACLHVEVGLSVFDREVEAFDLAVGLGPIADSVLVGDVTFGQEPAKAT